MISPAAAELIRRTKTQVESGVACVLRYEFELAQVWFNAANSSLNALAALLDAPSPPLRRMALVVSKPRDEEETLPAWMNKKVGDPDGAA